MHSLSAVGWLACASALPACTANARRTATHGLRIVAVEAVYGDLARQTGGDTVAVTTILQSASADPHMYEPSARDADAIEAADIVIENGLGYDAFADKLLAASPHPGRSVLVAGTLGGHRLGDNPHVWYDPPTLRSVDDALAAELARRDAAHATGVDRRRDRFDAWLASVTRRERAVSHRYGGTPVAITEPVFDYALRAMGLRVATPPSFSHAIEEGNDPSPQDVATMRTLLHGRRVAAFVYNEQTVEPVTSQLLALAKAAGVRVVPVTETLPPKLPVQAWIDGELAQTVAALGEYHH